MGRRICGGRVDEGNYLSMPLPLTVLKFHFSLSSIPLQVLSWGSLPSLVGGTFGSMWERLFVVTMLGGIDSTVPDGWQLGMLTAWSVLAPPNMPVMWDWERYTGMNLDKPLRAGPALSGSGWVTGRVGSPLCLSSKLQFSNQSSW